MVEKININNFDKYHFDDNVACIGYFDGVHLGHQELIKQAIKIANDNNLIPILISFEPDPLDIIKHQHNKHLLTYQERINKINEYGIDKIIIFEFNEDLMKLDAKAFINEYLNKMNIKYLISGYDFHFGYKGLGDNELLKQLGNFEGIIVEEKQYQGIKISSTRIKEAIIKGDIDDGNKMLGYEYYVDGNCLKCLKMQNMWEISIKCDENIILPAIYKDNTISFISNKQYQINELIRYIFKNE